MASAAVSADVLERGTGGSRLRIAGRGAGSLEPLWGPLGKKK